MSNGLLGYAAAGALAGIGQGMEQQAQQNGIMKREQMLAQLQQQGLIQRLDAQGQMQDERLASQDALQQRRLEQQNALETQREKARSDLATRQQDQQHQDRMAEIGATRGSIADQAAASRADAASAREAARGEVGTSYIDDQGFQHIVTKGGEDRKLARARTPQATNSNQFLDAERALKVAKEANSDDIGQVNWGGVADTLDEQGHGTLAGRIRASHGIQASAPAAATPTDAGAGNGLAPPAAAATPTTGNVVVPAAGPARPQSKADFDAMPSGTRFVAPDGSIRIKP